MYPVCCCVTVVAGEELKLALQMGHTQLENVLAMGTHLTTVWGDTKSHAAWESKQDPQPGDATGSCAKIMNKFGDLPEFKRRPRNGPRKRRQR